MLYIIGTENNDTLIGSSENDYLDGLGGDDVLSGGEGEDFMRGGAGVDTLDGGDGFDRVSFYHMDATQGVVADLATQLIINDGFGNAERMTSIEGLGAGTRFTDVFHGSNGDNFFYVGRDYAYGQGGDDEFVVEEAPLLLSGGSGVDTISQFISARLVDRNGDGVAEVETTTSGVRVDLSKDQILDDGFGNTGTVTGVENLGGSYYNDVLIGDQRGNDLNGHRGDDTLTGGHGRDRFVFEDASGHDRITDFKDHQDLVVFEGVAGVDGFEDLTLTADGGDVVVSWGDAAASIRLVGVAPSALSAADFLFG